MATNQAQPIEKALAELSREQLENIVLAIHDALYLEVHGDTLTVNPDKEWDEESITFVDGIMKQNGLWPDEAYSFPAVQSE